MVFMRIAIVKLSALGDIVHAMSVLQFIKDNNKEILIDWFVEECYQELFENHPDINKVHPINIKKAKKKKSLLLLYQEIKKVIKLDSYDLVIDMQGLIKSAILSRMIPSSVTIGFDRYSSRESLAGIFYNKRFNIGYEKNVIERNFELIKFALALPIDKKEIENKRPFFPINSEYINPSISKIKKNVILIPGASHSSKMYPLEKFAELTHLMDANYLVIWGNSQEKKIAESIKYLSPNVNVSKKLSLSELILLISKFDLIIGSDTGPTHFAWALNIPSITLFGSTPGYRNTFQTAINKVIESHSSVNPKNINKNDYSIHDINVEEILKFSKELLER
jgi:heptosyltransferase I